jgi:hypothetical protein
MAKCRLPVDSCRPTVLPFAPIAKLSGNFVLVNPLNTARRYYYFYFKSHIGACGALRAGLTGVR